MILIPKLKYIFIYTCNNKYKQEDIKRFISKIKTNSENNCWEWNAGLFKSGYGQFGLSGHKNCVAHRVSYELYNNKLIFNGLFVCHKCDNRKCVNPHHLFLGTHQDNMNDMKNKNRQVSGENNPVSKLTWNKINKIRKSYGTGKYTQCKLAKIYSIDPTNISSIINNKTWYNENYILNNNKTNRQYKKKLNLEIANQIRKLYNLHIHSIKNIINLFNITHTTLYNIINNKTWKEQGKI